MRCVHLSFVPANILLCSAPHLARPRTRPAGHSCLPCFLVQVANIIFIDQPAGTGYSYAKTSEAYNCSDTLSVALTYDFLRKWLMDHPEYLKNPLHVSGDSYADIFVALLSHKIYDGIEVGDKPRMNIKDYIQGNALTDRYINVNDRVKYANHMGLISDKIYQSAKENCNGNYVNADPNNALCLNDLQNVAWGTALEWVRCNESMHYRGMKRTESYVYDVQSAIDDHQHLTRKSCRAQIYRYKVKYSQNDYELIYATVKKKRRKEEVGRNCREEERELVY
ncbi:putative serine carboxypeptidase-like 18-like isoform X2 [Capsicum annuum]|nr:putative serine carboxypeptidase-like 18-like isoform X2 [Capsicum annuum]KAF3676751.1 putative serine carboxypeptidase-like 18-like isoform X2 [Capsicum annuum]